MLNLLAIASLISIMAAVIGHAYVNILADPEHILGGWSRFLTWHLKDKREMRGKKALDFIYKPIVGCSICNTGQWAMWIFMALSIHIGWYTIGSLIIHLYCICLSLILAVTLNRIFDK